MNGCSNKRHLAYIVSLLICYLSVHHNLRTVRTHTFAKQLLRVMCVRYPQTRQIHLRGMCGVVGKKRINFSTEKFLFLRFFLDTPYKLECLSVKGSPPPR